MEMKKCSRKLDRNVFFDLPPVVDRSLQRTNGQENWKKHHVKPVFHQANI